MVISASTGATLSARRASSKDIQSIRFSSNGPAQAAVDPVDVKEASAPNPGSNYKRMALWIAPVANMIAALLLGGAALMPGRTGQSAEVQAVSQESQAPGLTAAQLQQARSYMD
jgi:hypothetical protein